VSTSRKSVVVSFPNEAAVPREIRAAARVVDDSRAYAAKPSTPNLAAFREEFVRPIFLPVLLADGLSKDEAEAVLLYAARIAGTYSRYQQAKNSGLLAEIASPTAYRIGTVPTKRPAKKVEKVEPTSDETPES
jgi:hypothetical protein